MRSFIRTLWLGTLLIAAGLPILAQAEPYTPERPLTIGVILPLSGDWSSIGDGTRKAIEMAIAELSAEDRARLKIVLEDDQAKPQHTVTAFNKLMSQAKLDAVLNLSSATANAIAPLAEKAGLTMIAIASDPAVVANRQATFNFWVTPEEEAKVILPEMERRGYKRIARISAIHPGADAVNQAFNKLNDGNIEIVLDESYPIEVKDFRTYLTKLRARDDLDAVLLMLFPGQMGLFAKQARQMNMQLPFFGFEIMEDATEVKSSEGALIGAWYVNADDPKGNFIERFQKRYPGASLYGAGNCYDAMLLFAAAAKQAENPKDVARYLRELKDFTGVLGTYSASGDNRFTLPAVIKVVTQDGFKRVS